MGLLSRAEWRRVCRCYEIRRDLEHEDDEYEAGIEDCVYIFTTCIEVILSRDPIQLVRVTDFKELIEQASAVVPDRVFLEDFQNAPQPRQEEIPKFLISQALNKGIPDVVQQNAYTCITYLRPITQAAVSAEIPEITSKTRQGGQSMRAWPGSHKQRACFPTCDSPPVFHFMRKCFPTWRRSGRLDRLRHAR